MKAKSNNENYQYHDKCRICYSRVLEEIVDFGMQPIVHHLQSSENADYQRYPMRLGCCLNCGFLFLMETIDPGILYENYFTVSSWKNQSHIPRLIEIAKAVCHIDKNTKILEVGCNDGSFMEALATYGIVNVKGVEPTRDGYELAISKGMNVDHAFFGTQYFADKEHEKSSYDLIFCRQVLEHITDLRSFMLDITNALTSDGLFIIEVPDSGANMEWLDYSLWEEHVNYFTLRSLENLLQSFGFQILHKEVTLFSGRTITVIAERSNTVTGMSIKSEDLDMIRKYGYHFEEMKTKINELVSKNDDTYLYGCGARSSVFVNIMELDGIKCVIDDQPEKSGRFLPGINKYIDRWDEKYLGGYFLLGVNTENEMSLMKKRNLRFNNCNSILPPSKMLPDFWKQMVVHTLLNENLS